MANNAYLKPMIILFLSFLFNFTLPTAQQQEKNFWQVLAEVSFKKEMKEGYEVEVPQFSKYLKTWNGKKVKLKGFIIPVGEVGDASKFMFSSLPFNVLLLRCCRA